MRLRLMHLAVGAVALLGLAKVERLGWPGAPAAVDPPRPMAARAADPPPAPAAPPPAAQPMVPRPPEPSPEAAAERAVLEQLRARRATLETREQAAAQREVMLAAAESRLTRRVEELGALQARLEAMEQARARREEEGLRALVKLYEGMRPRDAARIFDELEMPVLLGIADRMREAKAAPVFAAMRAERARELTAEIARLRAQRAQGERAARQ
jgi:flagellar motility protein MotE (MotC chaperone)